MRKRDYADYDLLIGMDQANIRNLRQICGGDPDGKIHLLLEYAETWDREVADPWYTGDFEATWQDVLAGCRGILRGQEGASGTGKLIVLRQKVSITLSFKFDGSVLRWAYSAEYATDSAIP